MRHGKGGGRMSNIYELNTSCSTFGGRHSNPYNSVNAVQPAMELSLAKLVDAVQPPFTHV